jgi:hypothetical protein
VLVEHELRVRLSGSGKGWVPVQWLETSISAGLVGEVEQLLLLVVWQLLSLCG